MEVEMLNVVVYRNSLTQPGRLFRSAPDISKHNQAQKRENAHNLENVIQLKVILAFSFNKMFNILFHHRKVNFILQDGKNGFTK